MVLSAGAAIVFAAAPDSTPPRAPLSLSKGGDLFAAEGVEEKMDSGRVVLLLSGSMTATFRGEPQDFLLRTRLLEGDLASQEAPDADELRGAVSSKPYILEINAREGRTLSSVNSKPLNTTPYTQIPNPQPRTNPDT